MTSVKSEDVNRLSRAVCEIASPYFKLNSDQVSEALVRGIGLGTRSGLHSGHVSRRLPLSQFNLTAFTCRLADLMNSWETAQATQALICGAVLDLQIEIYPDSQRQPKYTHVPYDVRAQLSGVTSPTNSTGPYITLPEFFSGHGVEKFRVDSATLHRANRDKPELYPRARARDRYTTTAKLINNTWEGVLFVYSSNDKADDAQCLRNVRAAMARSILSSVTEGVHCEIYAPESYDLGAYRIVMRLSELTMDRLDNRFLAFDLPELQGWNPLPEPDNLDVAVKQGGGRISGVFKDGVFLCDLYPKGFDAGRLTAHRVKALLLHAVNARLEILDIRFQADLTPLMNGAPKKIERGTGSESGTRTQKGGDMGSAA